MRRLAFLAAALLLAVTLAASGLLAWTHASVRAARTPLPSLERLAAALPSDDAPVRLSYINTATQPMPRSAVLDPDADPEPARAYVMAHPSFVLEWADGRILLVDAGLTPDAARDFGKPIEWWTGAPPIEPLGSVADGLGDAARRVGAAVFTHMHVDHVDGLDALCDAGAGPLAVFMTPLQAERRTYTTRDALARVRSASCARIETLAPADDVYAVPGFPGVAVVAAAGHTPGSQLVVALVRDAEGDRLVWFAGDIANHLDGVLRDVGKPWSYRTFIVPEDETRLREVRRFLRDAQRLRPRSIVLVAHDQKAIEASGIPAFTP